MIEGQGQFPSLIIQTLKGLNERSRFSNSDTSEFDILRNCIPTTKNTLSKMNGCLRFDTLPVFPSPILGITQCFDSQRNILIQCRDAVYLTTEYEFFGITQPTPALVPYTHPIFGTINAVTATNPCAITTGLAHNLTTGDWVILSGIIGGTFSVPINGTFQVTVTDPTHFTVVSNCTVAPTDISAAIFTNTVNPAYNGDDELYPEALIVMDGIDTSTASQPLSTNFFNQYNLTGAGTRIVYQINPDGSPANFILSTTAGTGYIKLGQGTYRIKGWGIASGAVDVNMGGVYLGFSTIINTEASGTAQVAVANQNMRAHFSQYIPVSAPDNFYVTFTLNSTAANHWFNRYGKLISGFNIHCLHLKIQKTS